VLLKAVDERLRLTETVAACLPDGQQSGKSPNSLLDLVRQRVFGLPAGYLDGNDAARLADDPVHKLVLDREPLTGPAVPST
jgi:Transposase DDE domain group 1